ncbi:MAG: PAS domain S-box protein, partial [Desulforhopalus sp.]
MAVTERDLAGCQKDSEDKMPKENGSIDKAQLRRLAEEELEKGPDEMDDFSGKSPEELASLIHELRVQQIELTMQNEELQRIQSELEKTKRNNLNLYDYAPVGYATCNEKGAIVIANLTFATMLGIERMDLFGKMLSHFILKNDQDILYKYRQRLVKTKAPQTFELRMVTKDGHPFYARMECVIVKAEDDESEEIRIVVSDISESKKAELAFRENEKKYRELVENANSIILRLDRDGNVIFVNKFAQNFFGYSENEILGKSAIGTIIPEMESSGRDLREMYSNIVTNPHEYLQNENENINKNGEVVSVSWTNKATLDQDGNVVEILAIGNDISERKKAEDNLRESEEKYRSVMESMKDAAYICSSEYRIEYMNPAMIDKVGRDVTGKVCHKALYNLDKICSWCPFDRIKQDEHVEYEFADATSNRYYSSLNPPRHDADGSDQSTQDKDGEYESADDTTSNNYYSILNSPIHHTDGTVSKLTIFRDITTQKEAENEKLRLEKELIQAEKMDSIGKLAGGIAHDFNNILATVIGFTELALDDVEKGTPQEENLQEVYKAGKRAKGLVKQIQSFAHGASEVQEPTQLGTIAKEVLKLIRPMISSAIEIKEDIESSSLIMGNPAQIHQILMNLCTNAAHAMEETGGILEIGLDDFELKGQSADQLKLKSGNYMKISVSDTGVGIDPSIIDLIFEPHFTTKGVGKGAGMGLALAYSAIESSGGKLVVDSELGKGSIFSVYLPLTKRNESSQSSGKETMPSGTEHILFVDDELPVAKMGKLVLESLGYRVTVKTSSVEALELFKSNPADFDLVITDMVMPDMSGDILALELITSRPDISVILCTGFSEK